MKTILVSSIAATLICAASQSYSADYSVFKICQDQHVIHTSDGADAGHIEYIVVDPEQHQIVSTIVGGGVLGARTVFVPYEDVTYSEGNTIVLNQITRERLVSAPVFEHTRIVAGGRLDTSYVQQSFTYFGGDGRRGGAVDGHSGRAEGGADVHGVGGTDTGGKRGGLDMRRDGTRTAGEDARPGAEPPRPGAEAGHTEPKAGREVKDAGTRTASETKQNRSEAGAPAGGEPTNADKKGPKAGRDVKDAGARTGSETKQNRSEVGAPAGGEPTDADKKGPKAGRGVKDAATRIGSEAKQNRSEAGAPAGGGEPTEAGRKGPNAGVDGAHANGHATPKPASGSPAD